MRPAGVAKPGTAFWIETARRRGAALLRNAPNALTVIRPALGIASGFEVFTGHAGIAAWLYLAGYVTDIGDGFLSRAMKVESDAGSALDGWADVIFHAAVGLGLATA
ncbi:MAG: CDP-alcohol phosphatidyltransferase family protein, partial [Candidatus Dormibacteraeota bacterium]|nr:CDP-alcohol phosphatidyltransferase family protein [Candidatus Dormibacteraeota bacterium]